MKVIQPRFIDNSDITASSVQADPIPEWSGGVSYSVGNASTSIPSDYRNLVKKSTFQDGNLGGWPASAEVSSTAKPVKELRLGGIFAKFSQAITVTPVETLYIAFTVNSEFSEIPGKFGIRSTASNQFSDTVGVSFIEGKASQDGYFTGAVTVPSGVTSVNPVIYIPDVSGKSRPRYVSFLDLCVSRSPDFSNNLLTKKDFSDGTAGSGSFTNPYYVADCTAYKATEVLGCVAISSAKFLTEEGNIFDVYPGETLHVKADVKASSGSSAFFGVKYLSKAGAIIGQGIQSSSSFTAGSWYSIAGSLVVPPNARFAVPYLYMNPSSGTAYVNNIYIGRKSYLTDGPLVKRGSLNTVYQCVVAGVSTVAPELDPNNWVPVMATNEWAAFDREPETASTAFGSLSVTLKLNGADSLALFGVKCDSVTVSVTNSSGSTTLYGPKTFGANPVVLTDLPATVTTNKVIITLTGTGQVSLGLVDIGTAVDLGGTDYGATFTIVDYSRKEVDEFGTASFVKRGFAKKISAKSMFANTDLNKITSTLSELRATPCSWSITDEVGLETMNIFGWYEDLDINIPYPKHSYCSVNIQGLIE